MATVILEKYEGTGNDFLHTTMKELSNTDIPITPESIAELARKSCNRHFGIGADHLIIIGEPAVDIEGFGKYETFEDAHCRMYGFNSDGSLFEMSGNGIRGFALYGVSQGYGEKDPDGNHVVIVETLSGRKSVLIKQNDDGTYTGEVNMGEVHFDSEDIPTIATDSSDVPGMILGKQRRGLACNSGIPHWTLILDSNEELEDQELVQAGLKLRFDERFPSQTNVDTVVVDDAKNTTARFFERGAHETLSCGTGVVAVAANLNRAGLSDTNIRVHVRGGILSAVKQDDETWLLIGPMSKIARCEFDF